VVELLIFNRCLRRAEAQVRVQRVVSPDDETETWTVLEPPWVVERL
jgi:hypothetical protein